jgi:hypothetical protein
MWYNIGWENWQHRQPKWRNGRRAGLKNRWGQPRVSSSLTFGTRNLSTT